MIGAAAGSLPFLLFSPPASSLRRKNIKVRFGYLKAAFPSVSLVEVRSRASLSRKNRLWFSSVLSSLLLSPFSLSIRRESGGEGLAVIISPPFLLPLRHRNSIPVFFLKWRGVKEGKFPFFFLLHFLFLFFFSLENAAETFFISTSRRGINPPPPFSFSFSFSLSLPSYDSHSKKKL